MFKKILLTCGVLLLLAVAFVAVMLYYGSAEFKPLAVAILEHADAGRIEAIHERGTAQFRKDTSVEELRGFFEGRRRALGKFVEAGTVTGTEVSTTTEATRGEVKLGLKFEKGEVPGHFVFLKEDDVWKLHSMELPIPDALRPKPDRAALEPLSRELIELYNSGNWAGLYDRFAPELKQAYPAEKMQGELENLTTRAGKVTGATLKGIEDDAEGYAHASFDAQFERGTGQVKVKYYWREGRWDVLGFEANADQPGS